MAPFAPNATNYTVFRNVKDYGAVGDGVHDDTAAIKCVILRVDDHIIILIFCSAAISTGSRCGNLTCGSST